MKFADIETGLAYLEEETDLDPEMTSDARVDAAAGRLHAALNAVTEEARRAGVEADQELTVSPAIRDQVAARCEELERAVPLAVRLRPPRFYISNLTELARWFLRNSR